MKRITSICLVFFTVLTLLMGTALAAPEYSGDVDPSYAVMLIDVDSKQVLCEQRADDQIKPASTTKILTCILALEKCSLDDIVKVGPEGDWTGSAYSLLGTRNGEEIKLRDLLYGMMLASGNDAAATVAIHVAGSTEAFSQMMNNKAQELGMTGSHFINPHGVDKDNHYVTARDMSKLVLYAMKNQQFREIVKTPTYDMPSTNVNRAKTIENTNFLLIKDKPEYFRYANGIKTGSTPDAGGCLVASASKDDMNLIALVYGDQTADRSDRWRIAKDLFEWGFDRFETVELATLLKTAEPVQIQVENYAADDAGDGLLEFKRPEVASTYVTLEKTTVQGILDGTDSIDSKPSYMKDLPLRAPISEGDILGTVTYSSKATEEIIFIDNLIASRDVFEAGSIGGTAVATLPPTVPEEILTRKDNASVWLWLLIPGGLIVFLVIRLFTVNKRKRRRFKRRKPHYSYRIR
ncbi:MAG: D-alanyl-D-alanine carboxypeptidase family protein [Christensenellales bacterium]